MAKFCVFAILFAAFVACALAGGEPVKKVQLTEGTDLKTASSFGYGGYGLGFGGYGGYGGWGWGLPVYGWGGWGGLGYGGFGGYGGGFYG